jgi:hypothetical protein
MTSQSRTPARPPVCGTCGGHRWWLSRVPGALVCHTCHPRAEEALASLVDIAEPPAPGDQTAPGAGRGMDDRPALVILGTERVEAFLAQDPTWWLRGIY